MEKRIFDLSAQGTPLYHFWSSYIGLAHSLSYWVFTDIFEEEELTTVYTFFDNNLNISETARRLYVHRNTLVYRLEKIQKKTGLDVRVFDDALTFKIAMMVAGHMKYMKE